MGISFPDTMLATSAFPTGRNLCSAELQAEPRANVSQVGLVSFQCQKGQAFIKTEKWQMHQMKENEKQKVLRERKRNGKKKKTNSRKRMPKKPQVAA